MVTNSAPDIADVLADAAHDAQAEIDMLRDRMAQLEAALQPFADYADWLGHSGVLDTLPLATSPLAPLPRWAKNPTVGDLRRASAALKEQPR